jgi:hypothetical protein
MRMSWQLAWFLAVALWAQILAGIIVYSTLTSGLPPLSHLAAGLLTWFTLPATVLFGIGLLSGPLARALSRRSWLKAGRRASNRGIQPG